jgi:hypothetical protein
MFTLESSYGVLGQSKIINDLKEGNPRDSANGPILARLVKGSGWRARMRLAFICEIVRETTWVERRMMRA